MDGTACGGDRGGSGRPMRRGLGRGQALVLFVFSILVLLGFTALVIDVSWYWANTLRVQRAADAAALAGAVYLPGSPAAGITAATNEAARNGYTATGGSVCGVDRTCIVANPDPNNENRMVVTVQAPVPTYFMRIFGLRTLNATRTAKAEYVLPVPMGSPLNYFGVYGKLRTPSGWTDWDTTVESGALDVPSTTSGLWNDATWAYAAESPPLYASTASASNRQVYGGFTLRIRDTAHARFTNGGILALVRAHSSDATDCLVGIELSWDGGAHWSAQKLTPMGGSGSLTGPADRTLILGGIAGTSAGDSTNWWGHSWTSANFANASFAIRVQNVDPDPGSNTHCTAGSTLSVDYVQVQVNYQIPDPNVDGPGWQPLGPQGSWTGLLAGGASLVNGDPYLAGKDGDGTNPSGTNPYYNADAYYDYAVEMAPGASNGVVSIFDPTFCATAFQYGMGDHWYNGTSAVSTTFDLYDTNGDPFNLAHQTWIAGSGNLFTNARGADASLFDSGDAPSGVPSCRKGDVTNPASSLYWHDRWWSMPATLLPGHSYRLRVSTRDASLSPQPNALNNFSIFATSDGTLPRVHGLGSMVAFSPLPDNQTSQFFLAQIPAVHAGKTMRILLYDPGDTGSLPAWLQILMPTAGDYVPVTFSYTANRVASDGASCNSRHGTTGEVQTSDGHGGFYNGCWLTISIRLPNDYAAPRPASETNPIVDAGWWKVSYRMGASSGGADASDLTTWKVTLTGNPVHLIVP